MHPGAGAGSWAYINEGISDDAGDKLGLPESHSGARPAKQELGKDFRADLKT